MERTLDFPGVTSYDFSLSGSDLTLRLSQENIVTKIKIAIDKDKGPEVIPPKRRGRPTKMTADQVREIRLKWEENVKKFGTKTSAADHLAQLYGCSSKNIYAIIYRYSWNHIEV